MQFALIKEQLSVKKPIGRCKNTFSKTRKTQENSSQCPYEQFETEKQILLHVFICHWLFLNWNDKVWHYG